MTQNKNKVTVVPDSNPFGNRIMDYLIQIAKESVCSRSQCGSIIVINNIEVIGEGWNSRPCDVGGDCVKDKVSDKFKSDRTCCVHAEQRAIMDALKRSSDKIEGSTLYFLRLDEKEEPAYAGEPYCTICSKMALDAGIKWFCLYQENGWVRFDTEYYNEVSFNYGKPKV